MTVAELIEKLRACDPAKKVVLAATACEHFDVEEEDSAVSIVSDCQCWNDE